MTIYYCYSSIYNHIFKISLIHDAQQIAARKFNLPATVTQCTKPFPHRTANGSKVAFSDNGILLRRRDGEKPHTVK